jgi:hypothetical protein
MPDTSRLSAALYLCSVNDKPLTQAEIDELLRYARQLVERRDSGS